LSNVIRKLDLRRTKNDAEPFIPITPELRAAIDAMPIKHLTYLHTQKGPSLGMPTIHSAIHRIGAG
jgi:hypothetical protein